MRHRCWPRLGPTALLVLAIKAGFALADDAVSYPLKTVSTFSEMKENKDISRTPWGHSAACGSKPLPEVKAYPKLRSAHPLYGRAVFGADWRSGRQGVAFHFVIDESGRTPPDKLPLWMRKLFAEGDEPRQYDTLYFDRNRDLDLNNDPVVARRAQLPADFRFEPAEADNSCVFAEVHVPLSRGKDGAEEPLAIVPVLRISRNSKPDCLRLIPAITKTGRCSIGGESFSVVLSQYERIIGRFNDPLTGLLLTHCASGRNENRWMWKGADLLGAMRCVNGRLYQIAASPGGETLRIQQHTGPLGSLELALGERKDGQLSFFGSVQEKSQFVVPVGISTYPADSRRLRRYLIPEGMYMPLELSVSCGRTLVRLEPLPLPDLDLPSESPTGHRWSVSKGKPCLLELGKPEFVFLPDPRDRTIRPGEETAFGAVLLDRRMGMAITGIWDRSRPEEVRWTDKQGKPASASLPQIASARVEVRRASGEPVRPGDGRRDWANAMPWSHGGFTFYWQIPSELEVAGEKETFTLTVVLDMPDLYGTVVATRTFVMHAGSPRPAASRAAPKQ